MMTWVPSSVVLVLLRIHLALLRFLGLAHLLDAALLLPGLLGVLGAGVVHLLGFELRPGHASHLRDGRLDRESVAVHASPPIPTSGPPRARVP